MESIGTFKKWILFMEHGSIVGYRTKGRQKRFPKGKTFRVNDFDRELWNGKDCDRVVTSATDIEEAGRQITRATRKSRPKEKTDPDQLRIE